MRRRTSVGRWERLRSWSEFMAGRSRARVVCMVLMCPYNYAFNAGCGRVSRAAQRCLMTAGDRVLVDSGRHHGQSRIGK